MPKIVKKIFFLFVLLLPFFAYPQDKKTITLFHSPHCKACIEVKKEILPDIQEKYKSIINWRQIDTSKPGGLTLLLSVTENLGIKKARVPAILVGDLLLIGANPIKERLEIEIESFLKKDFSPLTTKAIDLKSIFTKFSVFTVVVSGLIDGINPCAFAVIVFFISFLAVYGYRKKEIIYVGTSYCLAVFITYLLLGLGVFNFLYSLNKIHTVIKLFYYFIAFFCFSLGILALYDFFTFKKTKSAEGAILQLPKFLKKRINITIGSHFREKNKSGAWHLAFTAFIVGFLVSLLEAVCTGQIYIPTIVLILKTTNLKLKASFFLILYNLMFILPLIIVFLLSLLGVNSNKFNTFLKKNLGKIKILMAIIFFILGIFILGIS